MALEVFLQPLLTTVLDGIPHDNHLSHGFKLKRSTTKSTKLRNLGDMR